MPQTFAQATTVHLPVDRASGIALYRQLYDGVRMAILAGRLTPGTRLPATRTLAADLGISRHCVVTAYEQLLAEGYADGTVGSGTYVAPTLPEHFLLAPPGTRQCATTSSDRSVLSHRGQILASTPVSVVWEAGEARPFRPGLPALDAFPTRTWAQLSARHWRDSPRSLLGYGDPAGYRPLREAIAAYLGAARAVRCAAEQVIVVAGAQQGLTLIAQLVCDPGDAAWIEDPGFLGARGALRAAGVRLVPVRVDDAGLDIAAGMRAESTVRLAYTTPAHQAPLGTTMTLQRRLALLEWAKNTNAWIIEDDYDSEYR